MKNLTLEKLRDAVQSERSNSGQYIKDGFPSLFKMYARNWSKSVTYVMATASSLSVLLTITY